ncbi:MAG: PIN domain-containing protein [Spirochaetaceae bacterium]|jgi:predicted nucleic acid-binding protein|nr:PIN domain-containing protein [Spirochaetaceae bacterium]
MKYIVDSCVWIDFFAEKRHLETLSALLMDDLVYTNKAILAELLPSARMKKEYELVECLSGVNELPLSIDWDEIAEIQYKCLKAGVNKIGLVDIIIAQNAAQYNMTVFSTDRHMELLSPIIGVEHRKE